MFLLRAWLNRLFGFATAKRPVRVRRGRRGGAWFSQGRGPRRLRARGPYRPSRSWTFERLEPLAMLSADTWTGGASGSWNVAANWDNGVPTATSDVSISGNASVALPAGSYNIASLNLAAGSALDFALDGTRAGLDYGVLDVTGAATLDGAIDVTLAGGYTPGADDSFQPLLYGSESGTPTVTVPTGEADLLTQTSLYVLPADSGTLTVTNTADSGTGSLRQAITTANGSSNLEFINFNIPPSDSGYNTAAGVWTISPATALPSVSAHAIIDATTQPGYAGKPVIQLTQQVAVSLGSHYTGLSDANNSTQNKYLTTPPDTQGAAGPNSYVETVNQVLAIYPSKGSAANAVTDTFSDFWYTQGNLPRLDSNSSLGDSTVVYDSQIQRFIVGDEDTDESGAVSYFDIAVSTSSNPATLTSADWKFFQINTGENDGTKLWADYPGNMGWNHDALVVTFNMFTSAGQGARSQIDAVDINALVNGTALATGTNLFQTDSNEFSLRPTVMQDSKAGDPMWLVAEHPYNGTNASIDVFKMTSVLNSSPNFTTTTLSVNPYSHAVAPKQPDGTTITPNGFSRITKSAMQNGLIVAAHSVSDSAGNLDEVQWYEIDTTSGTPSLKQQGDVTGGAGTYYTYPAIDINSQGDIGMTYIASGTGTGQFMSTYITGRAPADAAGTMQTPVLVQSGQANYSDNFSKGGREGDMSGINVDGDGSFWIANEFADTESNANWSTAIAHFTVGPAFGDGLDLTGGSSRVSGLDINGFSGDAIYLDNNVHSGSDTLTANYLGTDPTGTQAVANGGNGVGVYGSSNNVIGGPVPGSANLISGNAGDGVFIDPVSGGNTVAGNLIGTDVSGTLALPNTGNGVHVQGGQNNTVGGPSAAWRNVISANGVNGVLLDVYPESNGIPSGNVVEGNYVGVDVSGKIPLGNQQNGVAVEYGDSNTIGGTMPGAQNVISANGASGVLIQGNQSDGSSNTVLGNLIGTDYLGRTALANISAGVTIDGAPDNTIGGTSAAARNIISGNGISGTGGPGVLIEDSAGTGGATGNVVEGNYVGTDITGAQAVANAGSGVDIETGATNNTIGGTAAGAGNVISGNQQRGVNISGTGADDNTVEDNLIGTDATGAVPLGNAYDGIDILLGASSNNIAGNTISGNASGGVGIFAFGSVTSQNVLQGNFIGTDSSGANKLGNSGDGVTIGSGATNNTIGGTAAAARNIISGNSAVGVALQNAGTSQNLVEGNYIGTDDTGKVALPNGDSGVQIVGGAADNTVGGTASGAGNVISGNTYDGIYLASATGNTIAGNYVGTDASGKLALPNTTDGVWLDKGADGNTIGPNNVISGNTNNGVEIWSNDNWVEGNDVGTDVTGSAALPNGNWGVLLTNGATGNIVGTNADGKNDAAERNVISGNGYSGVGIYGIGTDANSIAGNFIGTDASGEKPLPNANYGVDVYGGAQQNVIGTSGTSKDDAGQRNVISANLWSGVAISDDGTDQNTVAGNYIGTDAIGTAGLGNGNNGVSIYGGAQGNVIGTNGDGHDDGAEGNVISGNTWQGVYVDAGSDQNTIAGNLIGVDKTGAAKLGNQLEGVQVLSVGNTIGGPLAVQANTIAGNAQAGIQLFGDSSEYLSSTSGGTLALGLGNGAAISQPTPVGSTAPITPNAGQALAFDGANTQAQTGATGVMNGASLTLEAWVDPALRTDSPVNGFYPSNVISSDNPGSFGRGFGVNVWSGGSQLTVEYDGGFDIVPGVTFTAGTWYHIAVVYQPGQLSVYVNGGDVQDFTFTEGPHNAANFIRVGYHNDDTSYGTTRFFDGLIDNVSVWSVARTASDISGDMNADLTGSESGLAAFWSFDQATAGNLVEGNYIGTNSSGASGLGNTWDGIDVFGPGNTLGGTTAGDGNVISGNQQRGVNMNGAAADGNTVQGNLIGTDPTGQSKLGNTFDGLDIYGGASNNTIAGNTISGNATGGVGIFGFGSVTSQNLVQGNLIGTDSSGAKPLGNSGDGVTIGSGATNNTVDGGNVISGNSEGVYLTDKGTSGNTVAGNLIGANAAGNAAIPNSFAGVTIAAGASGNTIGGTAAGAGNVISGNTFDGVDISGSGTAGNVVLGNYIGANATGTAALANRERGILIYGGAADNTIGGATRSAGNVISGNTYPGVELSGAGVTGNTIANNFIGADASGEKALGNGNDGIILDSGAAGNTVGPANVISANGLDGVALTGAGTTGNVVFGNMIGTDLTGEAALGNRGAGVDVSSGAGGNTVGGASSGAGNLISANGNAGVVLAGAGGDVVQGNLIGTDLAGSSALGNAAGGILIASPNATIGGAVAAARNIISGNTGSGVEISGASATGNLVEGNYIGTDVIGAKALGNTLDGAQVDAGAHGNNVANNVISANNGRQPLPRGASWTAIGPAPIDGGFSSVGGDTGRIVGVAPDPTNANVAYAATASGGVWKTTDATAAVPTWTPLTDNLTDANGNPLPLFMGAIAVAPNNHNVIYAGAGEANNKHSNYGDGILVSTDGGATWTVDNPNGVFTRLAVAKIAVDPTNADIAYAAVSGFAQTGVAGGENNGLGGNTGIWKTTDGGATWTNMTASIDATDSWSDVLVVPNNSSIVYAAVGNFQGATANGIYKSTNGGTTWTLLSSFPTGTVDGRISLAVSADSSTLYAAASGTGVSGSTAFSDLFKVESSPDGGATWTDQTANVLAQTGDITGGQGFYDLTIAVDPANSKVVYLAGSLDNAGVGMVETTDGGATWHNITSDDVGNSPHTDWHAMAFDAHGQILVGSDGGLWRKDPDPNNAAGFLWTDLNGNLNTVQLVSTALDPVDPAIAVGGSQDNGTELYAGSPVWTATDGGDGGKVAFDPQNPAVVYSANPVLLSFGAANFFQVSTDRGLTWSSATNGLNIRADANAMNNYPTFAVAPSNGNEVILGDENLWITTNGAQSWSQLAAVGTAGWNPKGNQVDALAIAPSDANTIYASTGGDFAASSQIFVSTNGGGTWTDIDLPNGSGRVGHLAVDPTNPQIVYAVVNRFTGGAGHVWRTIDGGANWTDISGNLPDEPTNTVAINTTTGALYVGNDTGAYVSTNFTSASPSWAPIAPGLPNAQVTDLEYNAAFGLLSAATFGRGAFLISTGSTSVTGAGVYIDATSSGNTLTGNLIGADATGTTALGNANGVEVVGSTNTIGGSAAGAANTIAFNKNDGVLVDTGTQNLISENSIFSSGHLGIELANNGNNNQAAPVLSSVTSRGGDTTITGTLTSAASTTYTLEFFANAVGNPSGFGEGQTFLGAKTVTTDGNGVADFTVTLSEALSVTEQVVTATATDPNNNTSAFSNDLSTLEAAPVAVSAAEGDTFSGTVATFTDADGNLSTGDYTATIDWGDNTAKTTVSGSGITLSNGTFSAAASHIYAEEGKFTLSVVINDTDTASATAAPVATISDPSVAATAVAIAAAEGASANVNVATFTDPGGAESTADYSATILWGGGQTSAGAISVSNGVFTVSGTNTYAEEGAYTATVTIAHEGAAAVVVKPQATVSDPSVAATAVAITAAEGASANVNVATFTDPGGAESTADYSATILWGDGQTSAGTISVSNGVFTVSGANTYAEEGTYTATVTVAHEGADAVVVKPQATVSDPSVAATAVAITAAEGASASVNVATFTDPGGAESTADYSATILWGDGQTSAGTISVSNGVFTVNGANTYAEEGTYTATVTVAHEGADAVVVKPQATVSDPSVAATAVAIAAAEGAQANVNVATFTDPGGVESTAD